jgi:light-harvesting protein B-800-850 alpha chain
MIYGKIWLVVKPSVGIPLMLSTVAVSSFAVHYALLTHTTWLPKYYEGGAKATKAATAPSEQTATLALVEQSTAKP